MSAANQITEQQRQRLLVGHHGLPYREMVRHWLLSEEESHASTNGGVNTTAWDVRFNSVCCITRAGP
ncbi:MAG TPA: hypothetical protein VHZ07_00785 [Bryobacteraceae bacterium]|jgi:hypothetical protein|nr:hypothetical protein [Bryobacteraceae bacterium]